MSLEEMNASGTKLIHFQSSHNGAGILSKEFTNYAYKQTHKITNFNKPI